MSAWVGSSPPPGTIQLPSSLHKWLRAGSSEPLLWWTPSCAPISGQHSYEAACTPGLCFPASDPGLLCFFLLFSSSSVLLASRVSGGRRPLPSPFLCSFASAGSCSATHPQPRPGLQGHFHSGQVSFNTDSRSDVAPHFISFPHEWASAKLIRPETDPLPLA